MDRQRRRLLLIVALGGFIAGPASAQVAVDPIVVLRGSSVEWCGLAAAGNTRLAIQSGSSLCLLGFAEGKAQLVGTAVLPSSTFVWDLLETGPDRPLGGFVAAGTEGLAIGSFGAPGASSPARTIVPAGSLFFGRLTSGPLRHRLAWTDGHVDDLVMPDLGRLRWTRLREGVAEKSCDAPVSNLVEQSLGWGLGYVMKARTGIPFFSVGGGEGGRCLFYQQSGLLWALKPGETRPMPFAKVPTEKKSGILGFDHQVADQVADWDGDGLLDLAITDPGGGSMLFYRGADRRSSGPEIEPRGPDQVLKIAGFILHRWLVDADGDGRQDFVLLRVPRLDLLAQVGVVRRGRIPAELEVRRQQPDGRFADATLWSLAFDVPVEIALTRNRRSVAFKAPVIPFLDPGRGFLVLAPDGEDGVVLRRRDGDSWETLAALTGLGGAGEILRDPFDGVVAPLDAAGGFDLALAVDDPGHGGRVLIWFLPG